ncbi:predicted protein, partial [Nematostella vectensis]
PQTIFTFGKYNNKKDVLEAVDKMPYPKGSTYTGRALQYMNDEIYRKATRVGVPNILIVLTDGKAHDSVAEPAKALRDIGIEIYSIGVGESYDKAELDAIATDPDASHVFSVDFKNMNSIVSTLDARICTGTKT